MAVAALITWILTALGGAYMLFVWISRGGHRPQQGSRFPPALIFGHFGLAAAALVVWIVYVATDNHTLAWIAFVSLLVVAVLGFTMLARWLPTYRGTRVGGATSAVPGTGTPSEPAERHFPVAAVAGHGVLAALTLVLVLLVALEVGG